MPTLSGLLNQPPMQGGLLASNRNNPFGLRARKMPDGSYQGEMMPKWLGWQGQLQNNAYPGSVSTELSVGDDRGEFPSITPNTTAQQLATLLSLKHGQRMPEDIYRQAQEFANARRALGLSPYFDAEGK